MLAGDDLAGMLQEQAWDTQRLLLKFDRGALTQQFTGLGIYLEKSEVITGFGKAGASIAAVIAPFGA